VANT